MQEAGEVVKVGIGDLAMYAILLFVAIAAGVGAWLEGKHGTRKENAKDSDN